MKCPHCGSSTSKRVERNKNYDSRVEVIDTIFTCKNKKCNISTISSTVKDLYNEKKTEDR